MCSSDDIVVQTDGLSRKFGTFWALKDLSLCVKKSQAHIFVGHNGAGKTTLIRILLGLIRPTSGTAKILGRDTWGHESGLFVRSQVGAMLESDSLYENLTAWQNLELFARIYRMEQTLWQERAIELLTLFCLVDQKDQTVQRWSAGMKRKLALVRAVLHSPQILVLDEPTSGLDAVMKDGIRRLLKQLMSEIGVTVLMATQDLHEAERIANGVTFMQDGRAMYTGSMIDFFQQAKMRKYCVNRGTDIPRVLVPPGTC